MENLSKISLDELITKSFSCDCGEVHKINAKIYRGEYLSSLKTALSGLGKNGCFISFNYTFKDFDKGITTLSEQTGARITPLIMNKKFDNSIENLSGLFALSSDIAFAIVVDDELLSVAKYFTAIRNIPLIYIPTSPNTFGVLDVTAEIKLKGKTERVNAVNPRIVVLDKNLLKNSEKRKIANAFCDIVSKIIALLDYRVRGSISGKWLCKNSYNLARSVVIDTFSVLTYENAPLKLAENGLKLSVVSAYTQGAIFENSAENLTAKLLRYMGKERLPVSECRLIAMRKLIGIYKLFFGEKTTGILEMPDYIERAEEFSALTGISELEVLNGFKESVYTNDEVRKKVFFIAKELFAEIDKLSSLISKINNTYVLLGGSEDLESNFTSEEIRQAIYHSTDFPCAVNILTLIRDTGMLELIK